MEVSAIKEAYLEIIIKLLVDKLPRILRNELSER
jgi:hypothetical protein